MRNIILFTLVVLINQSTCDQCFKAAVIEEHLITKSWKNPEKFFDDNLSVISEAFRIAASKGVKIFVTPEYGLCPPFTNRKQMRNFTVKLPEPSDDHNACLDETIGNFNDDLSNIVNRRLSCLARKYALYAVFNVCERKICSRNDSNCPSDGEYHFNTDVVFDHQGKLIQKYHKYHLYSETQMNSPPESEIRTIDTEYGRFGFLTCFDGRFETPLKGLIDRRIDHLVTPMEWVDSRPYMITFQHQQCFAIRYGVNVLAANTQGRATGAGIYSARYGPVAVTRDTKMSGTRLVIGQIARDPTTDADCEPEAEVIAIGDRHPYRYDPIIVPFEVSNRIRLNETQGHAQICKGGVCCRIEYTLQGAAFNGELELMATSFHMNIGDYEEEACLIVSINSTSKEYVDASDSFQYVKLDASFSYSNLYASVLGNEDELIPAYRWTFAHSGTGASVLVNNSDRKIKTIAIWTISK